MSKDEGWESRKDGNYWGCLIFAGIFALAWLAMLIQLGMF